LAGFPELLGVVAGIDGAMQPSNLVSMIADEIKALTEEDSVTR
jgi:hypothetical protein